MELMIVAFFGVVALIGFMVVAGSKCIGVAPFDGLLEALIGSFLLLALCAYLALPSRGREKL